MIAPTNFIMYNDLKKIHSKCSSFIRGIQNYTTSNKTLNLNELQAELSALQRSADKLIVELDAFEQNELGMK